MATLSIRLDDKLKQSAYQALEHLKISPTEAVRLYFQYIADNKRLPIQQTVISDDEAELLQIVRYRLANPEKAIEVTLDNL
ncbi:bifunctional antitoxin/transcriptional repressor RelB [Pelistega indica]|uniref:Bifunctional antitoxin/transcriptional repressor RelB n=1 Tax=Pelistega indica TaxID=1414851 RepID=V8FRP5_9BURK|nr:type II toxin-antitoxin system RelB/DinJ family antitoxin [Pelistega indica]ETD66541.1 bifunctional antitoxin/transcriptional repressor RelB [Pelistega indica]